MGMAQAVRMDALANPRTQSKTLHEIPYVRAQDRSPGSCTEQGMHVRKAAIRSLLDPNLDHRKRPRIDTYRSGPLSLSMQDADRHVHEVDVLR